MNTPATDTEIDRLVAPYLKTQLLQIPVEKFDLKLSDMRMRVEQISDEVLQGLVTKFFEKLSEERPVSLRGVQLAIDRVYPANSSLQRAEFEDATSFQNSLQLLAKEIHPDQKLSIKELKERRANTPRPENLTEEENRSAITTFNKLLDNIDMTIGEVKAGLDAMPEDTPLRNEIMAEVQKILEGHLKLFLAENRPPIDVPKTVSAPRAKSRSAIQNLLNTFFRKHNRPETTVTEGLRDTVDAELVRRLHRWAHERIEELFRTPSEK